MAISKIAVLIFTFILLKGHFEKNIYFEALQNATGGLELKKCCEIKDVTPEQKHIVPLQSANSGKDDIQDGDNVRKVLFY